MKFQSFPSIRSLFSVLLVSTLCAEEEVNTLDKESDYSLTRPQVEELSWKEQRQQLNAQNDKRNLLLKSFKQQKITTAEFYKAYAETLKAQPNVDFLNTFNSLTDELWKANALDKKTAQMVVQAFKQDEDMAKLYLARFLWRKGNKSWAFDCYFDAVESAYLGKYRKDLKKVALASEDNPFEYRHILHNELISKGLHAAYFRFLTSFYSESADWSSYWQYANTYGALNIYGESQCRLWAHEKGKRRRWLDHPMISANLLYQSGRADLAFQTLEKAGLDNRMQYSWLCQHTLNYDKLEATIVDRVHDASTRPLRIHARKAFYAKHRFQPIEFEKHTTALSLLGSLGDRDQECQIQYLLILGAKNKALQTANRKNLPETVFKLLCLEWQFKAAHQYVQSHSVIHPKDAAKLHQLAKNFYQSINHPLTKKYDSSWKPASYLADELKVVTPVEIEDIIKTNKKIPVATLQSYIRGARDPLLDNKIRKHLIDGSFSGQTPELALLEESKDFKFISDHYLAAHQKESNSIFLYLAGYYQILDNQKTKGDQLIRNSLLLEAGHTYSLNRLINVMATRTPNHPLLHTARKLVRENFHILQDANYSQPDPYRTGDYTTGARLLTARSLQDLESTGGSYSRYAWARHNPSHAHESAGLAAISNNDLELAEKYLQLSWNHSDSNFLLGVKLYHAYLKQDKPKLADRVFKQRWNRLNVIRKANPHHFWVYAHLAQWSLHCKQLKNATAIQYAQKLIKLRGDRFIEHRILAELYLVSGNKEKAGEVLKPWADRRANDKELQNLFLLLEVIERDPTHLYSYFGEPNWF